MSIFKKFLAGAAAFSLMAGVVQADTIKFGVTDITGLESLQTEYGDFVAVLEEITGDEVTPAGRSIIAEMRAVRRHRASRRRCPALAQPPSSKKSPASPARR